ncbi:MAG: deoxyguanosinetriphosphate triphosphohydrolase [Deltaproteobacteria bacterium]|nr:deoxyguanosinetriphosphate triphosphohydrolase [Deltaproteobacteria bacterium]
MTATTDAEKHLAPYAMRSSQSKGRRYQESEHAFRLAFQRDRDRIIHSVAFRRLEYKTQVFINHEGDYYRTRLTHTMEAAQIARTIARALQLNEDLAEAAALAHDLGHTPFGHAGERVLDELMRPHGGFEHNAQSLRIVDLLEERYPNFRGLNLSWELREGIAKHSPPYDRPLAGDFAPGEAPCLEIQIVDYADEIAYNGHDVDDGLQSGLLDAAEIEGVALWRESINEVRAQHPRASDHVTRYQAIRRMIDRCVTDLITTVRRRLEREHVASVDAVRQHRGPLVALSAKTEAARLELKAFLMENLYQHHRVLRMMIKAQRVITELFESYMAAPEQLPPHILRRTRDGETVARVVCDYIAGMTDRFALDEHRKLFDPQERV